MDDNVTSELVPLPELDIMHSYPPDDYAPSTLAQLKADIEAYMSPLMLLMVWRSSRPTSRPTCRRC